MKTNPSNLTPNLSSHSNNPKSRSFSLKRILFTSIAWGMLIAVSAAIAIAQSAPAQTTQRTDGLIETDVVQALDSSNSLKNERITAATIQGEVTLSGNVSSEASRELAEILTSRISGVTHVQNNLKVASVSTAQPAPPVTQPQVAQNEVQPPPEETAQAEQPQPAQYPDVAPVPPPQVQAQAPTQPQRPTYSQQQAPPPDPDNAQEPPPYPNNIPNPPRIPNNGYPQQPQQPNPTYGARAPEPPYDPTPLTLLKGTSLDLRTTQFLDDKRAKEGTTFDLTVIREVMVAGKLAIPRGAVVHGVVVESKSSGQLGGAPSLALKLVSIDLGPATYPLSSDLFKVRGPNKAGHTAGNVVGGAIFGALIGAAIGHGPGAAIGAIAGATTGTAISAATPGPRAWIPAEALVTFHLADPLTIVPVTPQEAFRLADSVLPPNGPTLYNRPAPAYYAPRYYAPGYYAPGYYPAPMPYYHPYYMVGGYYYWR